MSEFPHLKLPYKIDGLAKPSKRFSDPSEETLKNKRERKAHGEKLRYAANEMSAYWQNLITDRAQRGLDLPNTNLPVFLQVDTEVFKIESLINWGIDIIAEEESGYIIGASTDNLERFQHNLKQFLEEKGRYKDTAASIHNFADGVNWRLSQLLKGEIAERWDNISPSISYIIEIGVSCIVHSNLKYPDKSKCTSEEEYFRKIQQYNASLERLNLERDEMQLEREKDITKYTDLYSGAILDIWDNGSDAIHFKIALPGSGLKDLVHTYAYLYEVKFPSEYNIGSVSVELNNTNSLNIIAPNKNSSRVCVIDSGIEEGHRLIEPAIDAILSKSYVDGDESRSDYVRQSGHGTKVAGAVLYPYGIPTSGSYQLETIIQNARILDRDNRISDAKFTPALLEEIVSDFEGTRIFNLSITEKRSYIGTHMPSLAASIDKLIHENDILFLIAAGNIFDSSGDPHNPGIKELFDAGFNYPDYLKEQSCKIANPAVSYFGITVGSISLNDYEDDDYKTIAGRHRVSPFSRAGIGLWGNIKPDVVEFGGDYLRHKATNALICNDSTCPELVNSTLHNSSATGKTDVGTSFSTPKVSYIASRLQAEHPNETAQTYRALIIHSARLPEHCFNKPTWDDFCHYGYGIPNLDRALNNDSKRITFIQSGELGPRKADIYRINIPNELKGEGKNFRLLAEVTLAFTAKIRQTRKGSHSYLSSWLEWKSSKYNEGFNSFRHSVIDYLEEEVPIVDEGINAIKWVLRENPAWSNNSINRNNSTVQKSWVIIEPHQLANEFSIAIIGHVGWDKNLGNKIPYSLCVSFEIMDSQLPIYNLIAEAQIETETEVEKEQKIK